MLVKIYIMLVVALLYITLISDEHIYVIFWTGRRRQYSKTPVEFFLHKPF